MRVYNQYILTVATLLLLTTVVLSALNVRDIANYVTLFIIEALVVTELVTYFNRSARRGLNILSVILFAGFAVAMAGQVMAVIR